MLKIQIKSNFGSVLFEYEKENNTLKDTIEQAIKSSANLSSANLNSANLSYANLRSADLRYANLRYANLSYANLSSANLSSADLRYANLSSANIRSADLSSAIDIDYCLANTRILPDGDIIGYKKCIEGIVKLLIPSDAKRSHAFGRKCRAEYAVVLELPDGINVAHSSYDESFLYVKGETVKPVDPFSENWMEECESGIHFFITKIEAERY